MKRVAAVPVREAMRVVEEELKQPRDLFGRLFPLRCERRGIIHVFPKESLQGEVCLARTIRKPDQAFGISAYVIRRLRYRLQGTAASVPSSSPVTSQSINMRSASLNRMFSGAPANCVSTASHNSL